MNTPAYARAELADAIFRDRSASPVLLLAAWLSRYQNRHELLDSLVSAAVLSVKADE